MTVRKNFLLEEEIVEQLKKLATSNDVTQTQIIKNLIIKEYQESAIKDRKKAILSIENVNKFAKIVELSNREVNRACRLIKEDENYSDLNNTLQYLLAKKEKCKYILTNNRDFYSADIKVVSAKKFVEEMTK